jgi:hypothetical protein
MIMEIFKLQSNQDIYKTCRLYTQILRVGGGTHKGTDWKKIHSDMK